MTDILARLEEAQQWMREPDYAEHFSVADLIAWANRRPLSRFEQAKSEIERLRAELKSAREALAGVLPYMNEAEKAGLIGHEGCHWPVELVRDEVAKIPADTSDNGSTP